MMSQDVHHSQSHAKAPAIDDAIIAVSVVPEHFRRDEWERPAWGLGAAV